ncbi:MAG: hypothetical protein RIT26_1765 [Pseudomonadota bacterium]
MLHGLGSGPLELIRLAQEAHREGFSVFIPSIDGYCFGSELKTWAEWKAQIQSCYWSARECCETVSVVGLSMGATLAMLLAESERPDACVFLASALAYDGWAIPWYRGLLRWAHFIPFNHRWMYRESEPFGVKNEQTRAMVKRALELNRLSEVGGPTLSLGQLRQGQALIDQVLTHLDQIESPALFIHAIDDESVHIRNAEMAYRRIESSDKKFLYLGDSYHMITADNERETVHSQALRFIKSRVNLSIGQTVFEVPRVVSPELRRYLVQSGNKP